MLDTDSPQALDVDMTILLYWQPAAPAGPTAGSIPGGWNYGC